MDDVQEENIVPPSNTALRIVGGLVIVCFVFTVLAIARIAYQPPDSHESDVVYLDDATFEEETASGIVLVDFYTDWCGPCQGMAPAIESIATRFKGKVVVAKVNGDVGRRTVNKFRVRAYPTLVLLKDGQETSRVEGAQSEAELAFLLDTAVSRR